MSTSYIGSDILSAPFAGATVPGFDVLNPAQYFPNASSTANGSSSGASGSTGATGTTGSSSSTSGSSSSTSGSSSSSSTSSNSTSTENPYKKAYDSLETWVNSTLLASITQATPGYSSSLPVYAGGTTAQAFAQLQQTLAAIRPGVTSGLYGDGTGANTISGVNSLA